jgi:hypothetical protein
MRFFESSVHGYLVLDGNRYDYGQYITAVIYDLKEAYGFSCTNPEVLEILTQESQELTRYLNGLQP